MRGRGNRIERGVHSEKRERGERREGRERGVGWAVCACLCLCLCLGPKLRGARWELDGERAGYYY